MTDTGFDTARSTFLAQSRVALTEGTTIEQLAIDLHSDSLQNNSEYQIEDRDSFAKAKTVVKQLNSNLSANGLPKILT